MHNLDQMNRRSMMQTIALLLGAATVPTLAGCKAMSDSKGILSDEQLKLLIAIADTIIPKTDTEGAVGVKVPQQIDGMLGAWASQKTRAELIGAIDAVGKLDKDFAGLDPAKRKALLLVHDKAALQPGPPRKEKLTGFAAMVAGPPVANPAYVKLKGLIINLYYNSEIAMTKELIYEHNPGKYAPSLKVTPDTRPFAGLGGPF
jgi:gluconate 2-dehydrogenase gamma chain